MWMIAGIAGGIQPWWHHVGAYHEDRRMYRTPGPVMTWCRTNETYLVNRTPVANIGLAWSQRNTDYFGRDDPGNRVDAPYTGWMHALVRSRIPYVPVHLDDVERQAGRFSALILPDVGAISDAQAAALRRFVQNGGSLVATGQTGMYDEWGDPRSEMALADLFRCRRGAPAPRLRDVPRQAPQGEHTYLRLSPELRARVDGPKAGDEPPAVGERHAVLRGFDETDILPYGGTLSPLTVDPGAIVPLTFVPPFPTYPPETSWMRQPKTDIPGLVLSEHGRARVAFMAADIDRRYAREHLPDHARLLGNLARWTAGSLPLTVEGPGLIDCHLYQQPGRLVLHLVNLTSEGTWRAPIDEFIRVGPFTVSVRVPAGTSRARARLLVSAGDAPVRVQSGMATFGIDGILDHELVVLSV
jgi:hypothetical protein